VALGVDDLAQAARTTTRTLGGGPVTSDPMGADPHAVDPTDEQRHPPGPEMLWNESYYLDFVAEDGRIAGYARIGLYPNLGVTWWTTMLVGEGRPVVSSVAYDLPVAGGTGLVIDAGGVAVRGAVDDPLVTMSLRGTAPGRRLDRPEDVYRGVRGTPTTIALDLVWTTDGTPYHYDVTTRYEVPCLVRGEVAIGDERLAVDGQGQRDHSWGERDWWAFGWCWAAARLDDGTRVHLADIRIPGLPLAFGYLQSPGSPAGPDVRPVSSLEVTETLGEEGLPVAATARVQPDSLDLRIEPLAFGPVMLEAPDGRISRFPRALARFVAADGRSGLGWIEWNQPEGSDQAR
jgi:hypothetical protein